VRTIVHLSDLHFGRIDREMVDALLASVDAVAPDLVAISGDFTQRARRNQFTQARAFLDALRYQRLVVPGNHDIPLFDVARRFLSPLGRYREFIAEETEPMHADEEILVLGLNSARSLTLGEGRLNERQIRAAVERLRTREPHPIKIIVTHHPFDLPADYEARHQLVGGARAAMAQFASVGADLFLAGHLHVSHIGHTAERYKIAGHSALVVQAGTISTRRRGEVNSFNVLRIERPAIAVERWTWDEGRAAFAAESARVFQHSVRGWLERSGDDPIISLDTPR
jgi:3',5'-cyclic AMP phosphodiesterase CpdA